MVVAHRFLSGLSRFRVNISFQNDSYKLGRPCTRHQHLTGHLRETKPREKVHKAYYPTNRRPEDSPLVEMLYFRSSEPKMEMHEPKSESEYYSIIILDEIACRPVV